MKKLSISFLLTCAILAVSLTLNATIHYVYPGGRGSMDGTSWANAAPDIQYMLDTSNFYNPLLQQLFYYPTNDDTIFVAGGIYNRVCMHRHGHETPAIDSCGIKRLHFYGGFNGFETSLNQRTDWTANPSIIDAQGGRAVWFEGLAEDTTAVDVVFDGFIVTGVGRRQEAFRIVNSNAWISHVIIKDNTGIPFFLEHVPYYPNHDFYSTTTLTDVVVMDNQGEGWPASFAVSANAQLKIFNSTITRNKCDSAWNNMPLSLFYFYSLPSTCYISNSIIWDNSYGDVIVDITLFNTPPKMHHTYSIIEHCFDSSSDWANYGIHLGNSQDINPLILPNDYHLNYYSPAINMGNYKEYPYYQTNFLYLLRHPFAYWFYDADAKSRFNIDFVHNEPTIDLGAVQHEKNSVDEGAIIGWFEENDIFGGNLFSNYFHSPQITTSNTKKIEPTVYPTLLRPSQNINIWNIEGIYDVKIYEIDGSLISIDKLNGESSVEAPAQSGYFLLAIQKDGTPISKTIIFVKQ